MIGFRVDANEVIATGHLMRCTAIAKACEKRGEQILFFLAENKGTERLDALGLPYEILGTDWRNLEGEMDKLLPLLKVRSVDWLVVDSYQVTREYLELLEQSVRVLYVDDYGVERYDVSAVLNYSPWIAEKGIPNAYRGGSTKFLLGGQYIPLREEFSDGVETGWTEREQSVLITTGGTDAYNVAGRFLLECVGKEQWRNTDFHVIVGGMNSYRETLQALADEHASVHLHQNVSNMSEFMRKCRVAVSAGGTTLYELCACGIPAVCFSFADNQKPGTESMGRQGVMVYVGDAREEEKLCQKIGEEVFHLMSNRLKWEEHARKMRGLVDGKGAERIAAILSTLYM